MITIVFLDTTPLSTATNPNSSPENDECKEWVKSLLKRGVHIIVPEICDYEVRRKLLQGNKVKGLERLDAFTTTAHYLPLTTEMMRKAADLWAYVRKNGLTTADDKAIDGDVIMAAQAIIATSGISREQWVVASQNVKHLSRLVPAMEWRDIN